MPREGSLRVPNVDSNGSPVEALRQSSIAFRVPEGCKALIFGGSILKIDELSVLTNPPKYYHNLPDKQSSIAFGQFELRHCTASAQIVPNFMRRYSKISTDLKSRTVCISTTIKPSTTKNTPTTIKAFMLSERKRGRNQHIPQKDTHTPR